MSSDDGAAVGLDDRDGPQDRFGDPFATLLGAHATHDVRRRSQVGDENRRFEARGRSGEDICGRRRAQNRGQNQCRERHDQGAGEVERPTCGEIDRVRKPDGRDKGDRGQQRGAAPLLTA